MQDAACRVFPPGFHLHSVFLPSKLTCESFSWFSEVHLGTYGRIITDVVVKENDDHAKSSLAGIYLRMPSRDPILP